MKKYFTAYINFILEQLEDENADLPKLKKELLVKIQFMQHERLIHLIVLCLFSVLLFMSITIFFISQMTAILAISLLMLLLIVPYVAHYFFLENGVQQLYRIYDSLNLKISE